MTKQEILDALESMKEMTNDSGKRSLDAIKAGVRGLLELPEPVHQERTLVEPILEEEKPAPKVEKKVEPKKKVTKRRSK